MKSKRINKIKKRSRKMRSYKRSQKNNKKRTRRSFIKKKRTQINRRTKRKPRKILRGGSAVKPPRAAGDLWENAASEVVQSPEFRKAHAINPNAARVGATMGGAASGVAQGVMALFGMADPAGQLERADRMMRGADACILIAHRLINLFDQDRSNFDILEQDIKDIRTKAGEIPTTGLSPGTSTAIINRLFDDFLIKLNADYKTTCSIKDINYKNITEIIELFEAIRNGEFSRGEFKDWSGGWLGGRTSEERAILDFQKRQGESSCILIAWRLINLYNSNKEKFLKIKQQLKDLSSNQHLQKSNRDTLLTRFIYKFNTDYDTKCSTKDINYENITEIIELFEAIGNEEFPQGEKKQFDPRKPLVQRNPHPIRTQSIESRPTEPETNTVPEDGGDEELEARLRGLRGE
jgi:hypothetical protein